MKINKIIILVCIVCMIIPTTFAYNKKDYPPMLFERGIDVEKTLDLVYQIDPALMNNLKIITFHNHDQSSSYTKLGMYRYMYYSGYPDRIFNQRIEIYLTALDLTNESFHCLMYHELGHHYGVMKYKNNTEEMADEFTMNYGCVINNYDFEQYTLYIDEIKPNEEYKATVNR